MKIFLNYDDPFVSVRPVLLSQAEISCFYSDELLLQQQSDPIQFNNICHPMKGHWAIFPRFVCSFCGTQELKSTIHYYFSKSSSYNQFQFQRCFSEIFNTKPAVSLSSALGLFHPFTYISEALQNQIVIGNLFYAFLFELANSLCSGIIIKSVEQKRLLRCSEIGFKSARPSPATCSPF